MSDAMRAELLTALQSVHTEIVQWDKSMRLFGCDFTDITGFFIYLFTARHSVFLEPVQDALAPVSHGHDIN
jgi:hypothetical protein